MEGHQIGRGRSVDRQNWYVCETGKGLDLILHDGDQVTYRLSSSQPGAWRGERLTSPANEARMDEGLAGREPTHAGDGLGGLIAAVVDASGHQARATPQSHAQLVSTLRLLLRAEPGLQVGLKAMGEQSADLQDVVDEVLLTSASQRIQPVDKSVAIGVLGAGYSVPSPDKS